MVTFEPIDRFTSSYLFYEIYYLVAANSTKSMKYNRRYLIIFLCLLCAPQVCLADVDRVGEGLTNPTSFLLIMCLIGLAFSLEIYFVEKNKSTLLLIFMIVLSCLVIFLSYLLVRFYSWFLLVVGLTFIWWYWTDFKIHKLELRLFLRTLSPLKGLVIRKSLQAISISLNSAKG